MQRVTSYTKAGDAYIAFQVVGGGTTDLLFIPSYYTSIDGMWQWRAMTSFLERLASFARLIMFDQRGTGASDQIPPGQPQTLQERVDDIIAVLDAADSRTAAIFGASWGGGPLAAFAAATHPERLNKLVLFNTSARPTRAPDQPYGLRPESVDVLVNLNNESWGRPDAQNINDSFVREARARYQRTAMSPSTAAVLFRAALTEDVRDVLPRVMVPTLVIHRERNERLRSVHGRYIADHIAGARYVEVPGSSPNWIGWGPEEDLPVLDEVERFLTGGRPLHQTERVLSTVLFTDLVASTARASSVGDDRWVAVLELHDEIVGRHVGNHRGRLIRIDGDSALATFDGPARAIRCAIDIRDSLGELGLEMRTGVHTGEVELVGYHGIGGIAVHIGARVSELAGPGEILVSSTVRDLVSGSGIAFADRGIHSLKGVAEEWRLFAVQG